MTNVVSRNGYNIPKLTYDGQLNASQVLIGDREDFERLRDQVSRSGVFVIRRTDSTQAESFFFGMVDTPISVIGYRLYSSSSGMQMTYVTITNPSSRPNDMLYTGTTKNFTAAT